MRYHFVADHLGRSSNIYTISDLDFYRSNYSIIPVDETCMFRQYVKKGTYSLYYNIRGYDRTYDGEELLTFTSGILLITDPAFLVISRDWDYFINDVFVGGIPGKKNVDFLRKKAIVVEGIEEEKVKISVELESV
jgi:hypothetical protein